MFPPVAGGYHLDIEAISGILGSISIASWVVVFSPQIIENFRRSSAEGLSIEFLIIWLLGDVFNILGAILQGVLPTMIILAIYYTFADIVLLGQCFYYRGFTLRDPRPDGAVVSDSDEENQPPSERTALLSPNGHASSPHPPTLSERALSPSTFRERLSSMDGTRLSPATPLHQPQQDPLTTISPQLSQPEPRTTLQTFLFNTTAIILVILSGIAGYYLSPSPPKESSDSSSDDLHFSLWGQLFGYACALLYLGSRIPQILLNHRRQSTEGLNALFFIFACIGNLTYVLSILAFQPTCPHRHNKGCREGEASAIYGRYILVNLSWLIGSLGTLFLDFAVFVQFFMYRGKEPKSAVAANGHVREEEEEEEGRGRVATG